MPRLQRPKLDDPKVQEAKRRFEDNARRRKKLKLTFKELFYLFRRDCNTFKDIGVLSGVSREAIRQMYNTYFAELFLRRETGISRIRACAIRRAPERRAKNAEKNDPEHLAHLIGRLREEGLRVRRIPVHGEIGRYRFCKTRLRVNGKRCDISRCVRAGRPRRGSPFYWKVTISANRFECEHLIVVCGPADAVRYFVIPTSVLPEKSGNEAYIPVDGYTGYKNHKPIVDYTQFEDAWHLLGPTRKEVSLEQT